MGQAQRVVGSNDAVGIEHQDVVGIRHGEVRTLRSRRLEEHLIGYRREAPVPSEEGDVAVEIHRLVRLVGEVGEALPLEAAHVDAEAGDQALIRLEEILRPGPSGAESLPVQAVCFLAVLARRPAEGQLDEERVGVVDGSVGNLLLLEPGGRVPVELGKTLPLFLRIERAEGDPGTKAVERVAEVLGGLSQ